MNFQKHKGIIYLMSITVFIVVFFLILSFVVVNNNRVKKGKDKLTFMQFFNNNSEVTFKKVFIGMSFGIIFGFIDNFGLWYGMDYLDPYIAGGNLTKAGYGNTFSDFIGSTMGTSISIILSTMYPTEEAPIWVNSLGIVLGCLLGLYIPKYISGRD
jgi:hypothetical protein